MGSVFGVSGVGGSEKGVVTFYERSDDAKDCDDFAPVACHSALIDNMCAYIRVYIYIYIEIHVHKTYR